MSTLRLTVAQAAIRFLANQYSERDGAERRLIVGCFGIFGHGNIAGLGQALLQAKRTGEADLPYYLARNEQAMVHTAVGFARMRNRLQTFACTASVGPGSTNMLTGAALATVSRIPVLLLPGDTFSTRIPSPVLQELEDPTTSTGSVNDAFRPLSRFFVRVGRPEQLPAALLGAMRVLSDPAETGAATVCLPQDVQTEAFDWPEALFRRRLWHVGRPEPDLGALDRAVTAIRHATRPLIIAGGGVIYSEAEDALRSFARTSRIPVADTHAGKGGVLHDHPCSVGGIGSTGTPVANRLAAGADLVLGIGTRYSDFTTASQTAFKNPDVTFVNLNITALDAAKLSGITLIADARRGLEALQRNLGDHRAPDRYSRMVATLRDEWFRQVLRAPQVTSSPLPSQTELIAVLYDVMGPRDVVVQAAGSMPGQLQLLWRARDVKQYHVEYGYSCMGYEIAAALGVKMASPDREVFAIVGDGSYLMMSSEIVTAVSEGIKVNIIIVENHGFASIGALAETVGAERFGTSYRYRNPDSGMLDGGKLPVDLAANAASLGAKVLRATTIGEFSAALVAAKAADSTTVIHVETDPSASTLSSQSWWDVPVAEVAELETTIKARGRYEHAKLAQRPFF